MVLVVWLAALGLCSFECAGKDSHCELAHHASAASSHHTNGQPADSDKKGNDSFCDSLKSVFHAAAGNHVPKADFGLAFTLSIRPFQVPVDADAEIPVSRQPKPCDWVFVPGVCLGPAFRSHAPPVCSLT